MNKDIFDLFNCPSSVKATDEKYEAFKTLGITF